MKKQKLTKEHNPQYKYDCGNCKFNWCCGYTCSCLFHDLPAPPEWLQKNIRSITKLMNPHLTVEQLKKSI